MQAIRINILLLFSVAMFAAKPFIGFGVYHLLVNDTESSILVKSFTKRKQEFVEDSDFDMLAVQQRLARPMLFTALLFFSFFGKLFKPVLNQGKTITGKAISDLQLRLLPPGHLYLLTGKLSI